MNIHELLDGIRITPKLIYYIDTQYKKMMNQLRFSLGRLNGITSVDINRIFNLTDLTPSDFTEFMEEYPKDVYVMRQPIYNLLALIVIKAYLEGNARLALDTNTLLGMIFLGRLKYKYIRVVDQAILDKTLANLSKKSYIGLHGIVWMVNTVTKSTHDKWMPEVLKNLDNMYPRYRYIIDLRNKFNQIVKTIARAYYYNILHRNDIDRSVVLKNRTQEIINYIDSKTIPNNILEYAVKLCNMNVKTDIDKISQLHYHIQTYSSMQTQMSLLIYNILDRLFAVMNYYKDQNGKNIDINDFDWIKMFFVGLKRSTIILRTASDPIFLTYKYDRFEVIAYALVVTLFVDSINHHGDYYGSNEAGSSEEKDIESQYSNYYDQDYNADNYMPNQDYSFDESFDYTIEDNDSDLEALFEGVQYDKELFEFYNNDGGD